MKHLIIVMLTVIALQSWFSVIQNWPAPDNLNNNSLPASLTPAISAISTQSVSTMEEEWCENYTEMQDFDEPVPIIWKARLGGCLVSCWGASFTRTSPNQKYPRFAGYYAEQIPEKFLADDLVLKIYGKWIGIDADHPATVFENQCVPIVEIDKIEIVK